MTTPVTTQHTFFVGRDTELDAISQLLQEPSCRLLSLTGPGGIGKTQLALKFADLQGKYFHDGYAFVPLQPLNSPKFILSAIAENLPFDFSCKGDLLKQVFDYLSDKSLLLIMDNFEHLLEGVDLVSDLLAHAPSIKILATSRERLNLVEEWVYEVDGLSLPTNESESDIEQYGAVQLFMHHARRVHSRFTLTQSRKIAVSRICQLVGGMPLGIELASVWVRAMPCDVIADEVQQSLDILETPLRNVASRHRDMRAVFKPTWNRLTEPQRDAFMKLSVFRGSFTLEAAKVIAGASRRMLLELIDKSLMRLEKGGRYSLHELVRQYAEEQLNLSPQIYEQTLDLHRMYYMKILAHCQNQIVFLGKQKNGISTIGDELENIRLAWRRAVEQGQIKEIATGSEGLWNFY